MSYLILSSISSFHNSLRNLPCFNRIIPALTILRSRQLGVPASAYDTHTELLLKASYVVKVQAGISNQSKTRFMERDRVLSGLLQQVILDQHTHYRAIAQVGLWDSISRSAPNPASQTDYGRDR